MFSFADFYDINMVSGRAASFCWEQSSLLRTAQFVMHLARTSPLLVVMCQFIYVYIHVVFCYVLQVKNRLETYNCRISAVHPCTFINAILYVLINAVPQHFVIKWLL